MLRIQFLLSTALVLLSGVIFAQDIHVIELVPEKWNFKPEHYYFQKVVDERNDKQSAGQVLSENKKAKAVFRKSLSEDLLEYINSCIQQDTTKTPLIVVLEKYLLTETGTTASHRAKFDFSIAIYREIENKRYKIYEAKSAPELSMRGPYSNPHEKMIADALKGTFKGFDEFINSNPDLPPLAQGVDVIFDRISFGKNNDTIVWNKNNKLNWNDFKGKKGNNDFMAQSNCMFIFNIFPMMKNRKLELHLNLEACFEKNSSWVKDGAKNDTLLAHEQLHFDICEVNIRKIRKIFAETTFNPMEYDKAMKPIIEKGWNDYQLEQDRYDSETEHGIIYEKQREWESKINSLLSE